jgi:16S rRNA (cytidine1402-2'-O)-methyltransferase
MLIIGSTDIGNRMDISPRMINAILQADLIVAENIEIFNLLCNDLNISYDAEIIEYYHEIDNRLNILEYIYSKIKQDKNVLLVSDDGMPNICDPGSPIIRYPLINKLPIDIIPGPSILSALASASGLDTNSFVFEHRLPIEKNERIKKLIELKNINKSFMFIIANRKEESVKLIDILIDIKKIIGNHCNVVVGINLTKSDQFIILNKIGPVIQEMNNFNIKPGVHNIAVFVENKK